MLLRCRLRVDGLSELESILAEAVSKKELLQQVVVFHFHRKRDFHGLLKSEKLVRLAGHRLAELEPRNCCTSLSLFTQTWEILELLVDLLAPGSSSRDQL